MTTEHKELLERLKEQHDRNGLGKIEYIESPVAFVADGQDNVLTVGEAAFLADLHNAFPTLLSLAEKGAEAHITDKRREELHARIKNLEFQLHGDSLRSQLAEVNKLLVTQDETLDSMRSKLAASQEREKGLRIILSESDEALNQAWNQGYYAHAGNSKQEWSHEDEVKRWKVKRDAALQSTPSDAGRDGWQDIETAPRDGTHIWAFNGEQGVMKWIEGDGFSLWVWVDELLSDADPSPDQPTHFRPLPQPPASPAPADYDGAPYCQYCGAKEMQFCKCESIAKNH